MIISMFSWKRFYCEKSIFVDQTNRKSTLNHIKNTYLPQSYPRCNVGPVRSGRAIEGVMLAVLTFLSISLLGQDLSSLERIQQLSDSAWALEASQPRKAIEMYDRAIDLSSLSNQDLEKGKNMRYKALLYKEILSLDTALHWMEKADSVLTLCSDSVQIAKVKFSLATIHQFKGNAGAAARFYSQSLHVFTDLRDTLSVSKCASNLGVLYYELSMYDQAERYDSIAVSLARLSEQNESLCSSLINWGIAQAALGKSESAVEKYREALVLAIDLGDQRLVSYAHTNLADYFANQGQYEQAILNSAEALEIARATENEIEEAFFLHQLGYFYEKSNRSGGLQMMEEALALNRKLGLRADRLPLLKHLSQVYADRSDYKSAYIHAQELMELKDSIGSESTMQLVNDLRVQYEAAEKEKENEQLKHSRVLDAIQFEEGQTRMVLIIAVLVLLLALSMFGVWSYRSKLKSKTIIAEQERQLNEQRIEELRNKQTIQSLDDMLQGQQEERQRIANDLHDGLGGLLSTIQLHFGRIQEELDSMKRLDAHSAAFNLLDEACKEVRKIAHDMMPSSLEKLGLFSATTDLLTQLQAGSKIEVIPQQFGDAVNLQAGKATMIYRIIQEVIANVVKHANAKQIIVQFNWHPDSLHIVIEDDGQGFDFERVKKGLGLKSIDSRVKYMGGNWEIESSVDHGTAINLTFPYQNIQE